MWIDVHCHLDDEQFAGDLDDVMARAEAAGVQAIITAGTDVASSRVSITLAERYPMVYAVVGIHPQHADTWNAETYAAIRDLAGHRKVVGIGEIGLDFYWSNNPPRAVQEKTFIAQLDLAADLGKPVVIHNRNADATLMEILQRGKGKPGGILHCFAGDLAMARQAIELGFYISFAGNVTFKNATALQTIAAALPLDRMTLETDAPYLSPARGQRNEPANVARIGQKIAELKQSDQSSIANPTTQNSARLFGLEISEDC